MVEKQDNEKIETIDIGLIKDFPKHPYKVKDDDNMERLVESIKDKGILIPPIVRKNKDGTYQMISGHRRKKAAKLANLNQLNCIVKDLTDDEAVILMVDSNIQREEVLPSEKAFAYKMKLEALKHQGKKLDFNENETLSPLATKLKRATDVIKKDDNVGKDTIYRYIRLTYLIPELLELVDTGRIGFRIGAELSYLKEKTQNYIFDKSVRDEVTPNLAQAIKLKELEKKNKLNEEIIEKMMNELKPNQKENKDIKFRDVKKYFPKTYTDEKIKAIIHKLLKKYYERWHDRER